MWREGIKKVYTPQTIRLYASLNFGLLADSFGVHYS